MSHYSESRRGFEAGHDANVRPDVVTEEHLTFLDDLRASGATNMFGARPYLRDEFSDLTNEQAATVLGYWMRTFPRTSPAAKSSAAGGGGRKV